MKVFRKHKATKRSLTKILVLFFLFFGGEKIFSQCTICTTTILGIDSNTYTVTIGQTFCVDSTGIFNGTVILNGGTICNRGSFKPSSVTFTSGTFYNYGSAAIITNTTFGSSISWTNYGGSILNLDGSLTVSGGTMSNDGILNVDSTLTFSSGTFSNSKIINCTSLTGSGTISNTGTINSD